MDKPIATTLPAKFYADKTYYQKEAEHFFGQRWVCLGREEEVSEPGQFVQKKLLNESLLLVRGKDTRVRAFYNLCRHRGTQVCQKENGKFLGSIQCPYHAWTYNLEGKLTGAPLMNETPGFNAEEWPLHQAACEVWEGHVFVNMAKEPRPLLSQLGEMATKFENWHMADLRVAHRIVYDIKANWKLIIQNYSECLHCPVIHPALAKLSPYLSGNNDPADDNLLGGSMTLYDGVRTMTMSGQTTRADLPHLSEKQKRHVYYYALLPNLLLSPHPDFVMTHLLLPLDNDRTQVINEYLFHPDQMAQADFSPADVVEFWDLTNRQDWEVSEWSQKGLESRAYSPGPYSHREGLLHDLDKIILSELG